MTERLAHGRHGDAATQPGAIDVAAIVTDAVASRGHNLVTRPTGRAVREAIEQRLALAAASPARKPPSPHVMLIDFTRVRILDFSCADEVVAKLLLRYQGPDRPGNIFFLFRAVDEMHRHAVEEVLERHGLAAVCDVGGGFQLLGPATPEERKAWDTLERCERIGPRDLAEALGELGEPLLIGLARRRLAYWSGNCGAAALSALARTR
ncbi:MAG: hypothetical protein OXU74_08645 [Gemmatimonadota bacterium]|nr:hypothetical protein [Gemmatimonadota bacterium]